MEFQFLGRGAAFNPKEGNTAACYIENGRMLLVDCGETVFERLLERQLLEGLQAVDVCITHLHSDHVGSLPSLLLYCRYSLKIPARLILPKEDEDYCRKLTTLLGWMGCPEGSYCVETELNGTYTGVRTLRYMPTEHTADLEAFSLAFETEHGWVFYSGDTSTTRTLSAFLDTNPLIDRIYLDATTADYPGNVHLPLRTIAEFIPESLREKTYLMHVNEDDCITEGERLGFSVVAI